MSMATEGASAGGSSLQPKIFHGFFPGLQCWLFGICNRPGSCCTNRRRGYDSSGNPYGSYKGRIKQGSLLYSVERNYTSKGITSRLIEFACGAAQPQKPFRIGRGVIYWFEIIDYGLSSCVDANFSLTRVGKRGNQWNSSFITSSNDPGSGIMNHTCLPCNLL